MDRKWKYVVDVKVSSPDMVMYTYVHTWSVLVKFKCIIVFTFDTAYLLITFKIVFTALDNALDSW